jgi:hypothetical protein
MPLNQSRSGSYTVVTVVSRSLFHILRFKYPTHCCHSYSSLWIFPVILLLWRVKLPFKCPTTKHSAAMNVGNRKTYLDLQFLIILYINFSSVLRLSSVFRFSLTVEHYFTRNWMNIKINYPDFVGILVAVLIL